MRIPNFELAFLDYFFPYIDERIKQQWTNFTSYWHETARKYNYYHMLVTEVNYGKYKDGKEYAVVTPMAVFTEVQSLVTFLLNSLEYKDASDLDIRTGELYIKTKNGGIWVYGIPLNTVNADRGYEMFKFDKDEPWLQ